MIDIVIPSFVVDFAFFFGLWLVFGLMFTVLNYIGGTSIRFCLIIGLLQSAGLVGGVLLISSLFTGSPISIQIVNLSLVRP